MKFRRDRPANGVLARVAAVLLCLQSTLFAADSVSLEYEVKAAFLLNFTKFVEWPATAFPAPDSPLTICIAGDDPFGRAIDQIVEGESVNGHKITIERVHGVQTKTCQVIYASRYEAVTANLAPAAPAALTVGEGDVFLQQGGMVGFVMVERRVRFDINLKAANSSGLRLSSRLLTVARSVEK